MNSSDNKTNFTRVFLKFSLKTLYFLSLFGKNIENTGLTFYNWIKFKTLKSKGVNMDLIDKKILKILSNNAGISASEISNEINLSVPAVNKRILKMKKDKIIRKFTVITDEKKVEKPIIAFIFIVMQYSDEVEKLLHHIQKDSDILECYAVTGEYDYLIKVCAKDVRSLEDKLLELKRKKGVIKSHTMLSLMEHKFEPTILPNEEI